MRDLVERALARSRDARDADPDQPTVRAVAVPDGLVLSEYQAPTAWLQTDTPVDVEGKR